MNYSKDPLSEMELVDWHIPPGNKYLVNKMSRRGVFFCRQDFVRANSARLPKDDRSWGGIHSQWKGQKRHILNT
jgi:hypothetical protein